MARPSRATTTQLTSNLPPCTCHLVLLGRATMCARDGPINNTRRGSLPDYLEGSTFPDGTRPNSCGAVMVYPDVEDLADSSQPDLIDEAATSPARSGMRFQDDGQKAPRKFTKNTAMRRLARTTTVGSKGPSSPRCPWGKYLHHFDQLSIDRLYARFSQADVAGTEAISIEDALMLAAKWNRSNHNLQEIQPSQEDLDEVLTQLGVQGPDTKLTFDDVIQFIRLVELKVLQADPFAGFLDEDVRFLSRAFKMHSKDRLRKNADGSITEEMRRSLCKRDVFQVLNEIGRDCSDVEQQKTIRELIQVMDVDKSGDLDFGEFLQFARRVRQMDEEEERELERRLICENPLHYVEKEDMQALFRKYAEATEGVFYIQDFSDVVASNTGKAIDVKDQEHLDRKVRAFGCLEENDDAITFGQFLNIMTQLIDQDVCQLKSTGFKMLQQMEDDKRFLSPQAYQQKYATHDMNISSISSTLRRMADNTKARSAHSSRRHAIDGVKTGEVVCGLTGA
eukprot:gnl/MRDRNA2_/MRDRNA2_33826_c0_seq1.p1 gnl/MRDRNA2_/MRDRNA2_33826_c0~~gnl/MRDRNA2_/MRDRNA2_33826_c0_seq1.p1  ORF type:complete len:542 (+),score=93.68 gnl/MRDRNA2_/MRDRNA2_33826_c0_seq1:105-1628(+)